MFNPTTLARTVSSLFANRLAMTLSSAIIACLLLFYTYQAWQSGDPGVFAFFALGLCVLVPLERLMPRHAQPFLRPHFVTDLMHVLLTGLLAYLPVALIFPLLQPLRIDATHEFIQSLPLFAQAISALIVQEFLIYWGHRFSHEVPILWRFHAVHHSVIYLDWLGGERRHPLDALFMSFCVGVPMLITGFDLVDLLLLGVFNALWDMTIHANLGWRLKFLDGIWVTTEYHHWHHADDLEARDKNYAGALPVFDWLFGTYHLPPNQKPAGYGIDSTMPDDYFGQLLQPFRPMRPKAQQDDT